VGNVCAIYLTVGIVVNYYIMFTPSERLGRMNTFDAAYIHTSFAKQNLTALAARTKAASLSVRTCRRYDHPSGDGSNRGEDHFGRRQIAAQVIEKEDHIADFIERRLALIRADQAFLK
jgi:hypothetical protein